MTALIPGEIDVDIFTGAAGAGLGVNAATGRPIGVAVEIAEGWVRR